MELILRRVRWLRRSTIDVARVADVTFEYLNIASLPNTNFFSDTLLVLQVYVYSWITLLVFVAIFKVEFYFV
jgi:hypothetical protein